MEQTQNKWRTVTVSELTWCVDDDVLQTNMCVTSLHRWYIAVSVMSWSRLDQNWISCWAPVVLPDFRIAGSNLGRGYVYQGQLNLSSLWGRLASSSLRKWVTEVTVRCGRVLVHLPQHLLRRRWVISARLWEGLVLDGKLTRVHQRLNRPVWISDGRLYLIVNWVEVWAIPMSQIQQKKSLASFCAAVRQFCERCVHTHCPEFWQITPNLFKWCQIDVISQKNLIE